MSERTNVPRPGGRAAEPGGVASQQRTTTGQRSTGSRNADANSSDARGARHSGGTAGDRDGDTRRSGIRSEDADRRMGAAAGRGDGRDARATTDSVRRRTADADRGRDRARGADAGGSRDRAGSPDSGARAELSVPRSRADRVADRVRVDGPGVSAKPVGSGRSGGSGELGGGGKLGRSAMPSGSVGAGGSVRAGGSAMAGWRGRRTSVDAPVAGTAALQVEVTVAEPLRVSDPAVAPRLRVAPPAPISAPRAPFVAVMIGVVIAGVLGILLINTQTNENSFKIADLQKQGSVLDNQQEDLANQLVDVSSIGNLNAAARRLGLVKADNVAMIRLPDGKLIGVLTPTNGKPAVTARDAETGADADKGAANIVPDTGAATPPSGLTPNGTPTAGTLTTNGTAANGVAGNGTAANGTAANGVAGNGTAANGTAANGVAANGTGTAANGMTANGTVPGNGTAPAAGTPNGAASTGNGQ